MFTREILANPDLAAFPHCHCPSIAYGPCGDLVVAWYAYPDVETRGGVLMFTHRRCGETRFTTPRRLFADMRSSLGNPLLFFDATGRLHILFVSLAGQFWDSASIHAAHSDDLGATWSAQYRCALDQGVMVRHGPMIRRNSYLLLPTYDEKTNQTVILTAGGDAEGWMAVERLSGPPAIQGDIVRQNESDLVMFLRPAGDGRCCLRSISGDDGRSWSPAMKTPLPNPLSGVAAFQVGETLCAVYNHTTEHRRYPLSLSWSEDRGTSWSGPLHIDETEHELSYPSFVVDDRGVAHGVYTFGRNRIRYVSFDRAWWTP